MRRSIRVLAVFALTVGTAVPVAAQPATGCWTEEVVGDHTGEGPDPTCLVARPGISVTVHAEDGPSNCLTNYLFVGSDGHRYLGTLGYCVLHSSDCDELVVLGIPICLGGEETTADGPVVYPKGKGLKVTLRGPTGARIGEVAYAVYEPGSSYNSFALIRLDKKVSATAAVRHWGGPTGVDRRITSAPEDVLVVSHVAQNEAVATYGFPDAESFRGVVPQPVFMLGGPMLNARGEAVGIVTSGADGAYVERVDPVMRRAAGRLKITLRIATARFTGVAR